MNSQIVQTCVYEQHMCTSCLSVRKQIFTHILSQLSLINSLPSRHNLFLLLYTVAVLMLFQAYLSGGRSLNSLNFFMFRCRAYETHDDCEYTILQRNQSDQGYMLGENFTLSYFCSISVSSMIFTQFTDYTNLQLTARNADVPHLVPLYRNHVSHRVFYKRFKLYCKWEDSQFCSICGLIILCLYQVLKFVLFFYLNAYFHWSLSEV